MTDVSEILRDGADTFERKTTDYGSSWKSQGEILSIMAHGEPIVLETKEEIIAFGLFTRRLDKLSREFFGTFFADEMNFEGPIDSAEDESVYAAMSSANLRDMESASEKNAAPTAVADGGLSEASFEELTAILTERRREAEKMMEDVNHEHEDFHGKQWLG
jgi:hypothetical protein